MARAAGHAVLRCQPVNRLGLAQWSMAPENPLTARVMANRLWLWLILALGRDRIYSHP